MKLKGTALDNPYPTDEIRPHFSSMQMYKHRLVGGIRTRNHDLMVKIDEVYNASLEKDFQITDMHRDEITIIFKTIDDVLAGKF